MSKLALPKTVWAPALVLANVVLAVFLAMTTMHGLLLNIAMMLGGPAAAAFHAEHRQSGYTMPVHSSSEARGNAQGYQ